MIYVSMLDRFEFNKSVNLLTPEMCIMLLLIIFKEVINVNIFMSSRGQGLVEYGLLIVLVAVVVIAVVILLGPIIGNVFSNVNSTFPTVAP